MAEPTLSSLHPQHFPDSDLSLIQTKHGLQGSYKLNLPRVSRSLELSRPYQAGDPIRHIDWKAFARNDQLIVRQEKNEAMAKAVVVLDAASTMDWPDQDVSAEFSEPLVSKFAISTRIALHLVHRHLRMGDQIQLVFLQSDPNQTGPGNERNLPLSLCLDYRTPSDILSFFDFLENQGFTQENFTNFLRQKQVSYSRIHTLYWISDLCTYQIPDEMFIQARRVCLFHVLSHLECDVSWMKDKTCYFEPDGVAKEFLGRELRKNDVYTTRLQQWIAKNKKSVEDKKGLYALFTDQTSLRNYASILDHLTRWYV